MQVFTPNYRDSTLKHSESTRECETGCACHGSSCHGSGCICRDGGSVEQNTPHGNNRNHHHSTKLEDQNALQRLHFKTKPAQLQSSNLKETSPLGEAQLSKFSTHKLCSRECMFPYLHLTRLKTAGKIVLSCFVRFISSLLANSPRSKRSEHFRGNLLLALSTLLLSASFVTPIAAQNGIETQHESRSSSPFQPWVVIVAEIDSNPEPESGLELESVTGAQRTQPGPFQFPDLVIPVNRLFQYQIPSDAFRDLEAIVYYKVYQQKKLCRNITAEAPLY